MVAALISRADTKCFMVNGERARLHSQSESGGFRDPQTSAHLPRMAPGLHNGAVPGHWRSAVSKGLFDGTDVVSVVASPMQPR